MGFSFSKLFSRLHAEEEVRILMVGLDGAGKTTILCYLGLGEIVTTTPIAGNVPKPRRTGFVVKIICAACRCLFQPCHAIFSKHCFPHSFHLQKGGCNLQDRIEEFFLIIFREFSLSLSDLNIQVLDYVKMSEIPMWLLCNRMENLSGVCLDVVDRKRKHDR